MSPGLDDQDAGIGDVLIGDCGGVPDVDDVIRVDRFTLGDDLTSMFSADHAVFCLRRMVFLISHACHPAGIVNSSCKFTPSSKRKVEAGRRKGAWSRGREDEHMHLDSIHCYNHVL